MFPLECQNEPEPADFPLHTVIQKDTRYLLHSLGSVREGHFLSDSK